MIRLINNARRWMQVNGVSIDLRENAKDLFVLTRVPSAEMRLTPTFFLIGAMKAGTTTLFNNLVEHPRIAEPLAKEIRYFDFHYVRGPRWYRAHFSGVEYAARRGETITGEASPSYLFDPHASRRLHEFQPAGKILVLLRNPVDRAYSHYQHAVRYFGEDRSFLEAIQSEDDWFALEQHRRIETPGFMSLRRIRHSYLARGRYLEQLRPWLDLFGRENLLVLKSEDFFERPEDMIHTVTEFLELEPWQPENVARLNAGHYQRLDPETRAWLYDYFAAPNRALYAELGIDFGWERQRDGTEDAEQ